MQTIEDVLDALKAEISTLKARVVVDDEVVAALKRMRSNLFGFGFYDPATEKDRELACLLRDDMYLVVDKLKIK